MNTLELAKQLKYREGDQVRGIAHPYERSIYRVVRIDHLGVHLVFESLCGFVVDYMPYLNPIKRLLKWNTPVLNEPWGDFEGAFDFRIAMLAEIKYSREVKK